MMAALQRAEARMRTFAHIDWYMLFSALAISLLGLVTMRSFIPKAAFFEHQLIWICVSLIAFLIASMIDYSFLRRTPIVVGLFVVVCTLLALIFIFGSIVYGSQNRFDLGFFAIQPSDPAKLILVIVLAKYFHRRHIEIKHFRHIVISGAYAFTLFVLVFFQPDLGSGIIIFSIWFGMVLVAGISWKHLAVLFLTGTLVFAGLWSVGLREYQKARILTFIHPLTDIRNTGYNAYQSTVAVGSGLVTGKGIGYGTQSKLQFLPEYETDFIFAAYAEEWGFVGVILLLGLFGVLIMRILAVAVHGANNFDSLLAAGIAIYFLAQFIVHVGMNMAVLPITGTTLPFMSYGGSHLLTEYLTLGVLMGLRKYARPSIQARDETELVGVI